MAEDCDYDWATERAKAVTEKGVQRKEFGWVTRSRVMVWEKREGRWHGRWRWTEWTGKSELERRIRSGRERAICAWNSSNIPQELLLLVLEYVIVVNRAVEGDVDRVDWQVRSHDASDLRCKDDCPGLGDLALVCRAWHILVAPVLYGAVAVNAEGGVSSSTLRESTARHATKLVVRRDRKSTRLNSSHSGESRMPSSA